jgi:hypothetical protein
MKIITTPKTGRFAHKTVFTNRDGQGIFTKLPNGVTIQHTGICQTPTFTSPAQLSAWLRRNYNY